MTTNGDSFVDGDFLNVRATPSKKNNPGDYFSSTMASSDEVSDEVLPNKRPRLDKRASEERQSRSSPGTRPRQDQEDPTDGDASGRDMGNEAQHEDTLGDQSNRGDITLPTDAQQDLSEGGQPTPHEMHLLRDQQEQRNWGITTEQTFGGSSLQHPIGDHGGPFPNQQMVSSMSYEQASRLPTSLVAQQLPRYMLNGQSGGTEPFFQPAFHSALMGEGGAGFDPYMHPMNGISLLAQRFPQTAASMGTPMGLLGRAEFSRQDRKTERDTEDIPAPPNPDALTLYIESDDGALSQYQCAVRKQIELFAAEEIDVENKQGRNKPVVLGQAGIRCIHCASVHPRRRTRASTYYPSKLSGFYQAAQNLASDHLLGQCSYVPHPLRRQLLILKERKSSAGGGKDYWATAAKAIGVIEDHKNGILRFEDKREKPTKNKEDENKDDKVDEGRKEEETNDADHEAKKKGAAKDSGESSE